MANWAEINENNLVTNIIVAPDELDHGESWIKANLAGRWVRTSYNTKRGAHLLGKTPFRKNFAQIGFTYDEQRDAFIPPKNPDLQSWVLDERICDWVPPVEYPSDGGNYIWDEVSISWIMIAITEASLE